MWQFFFAGWGMVMIVMLFAAAMLHQNIMWTPIQYIDMAGIARNQFRMENPSFRGIDQNGNPFSIYADHARKEYDLPDTVFIDTVRARIIRVMDDVKITDNISADFGRMDINDNIVILTGNVAVDSDNGDRLRANELIIRL